MVQTIKGNIEVSKLLSHAGTSLAPERHQGTAHMAQCYLGTGGQQGAQEVLCPHMHRAGCGVHMEPHSREKGWEYPGFLMLQIQRELWHLRAGIFISELQKLYFILFNSTVVSQKGMEVEIQKLQRGKDIPIPQNTVKFISENTLKGFVFFFSLIAFYQLPQLEKHKNC